MSSTNRSNARRAHVSDYYCTPIDQIQLFLKEFLKVAPSVLNGDILDPASGGSSTEPMSYPEALVAGGGRTSEHLHN